MTFQYAFSKTPLGEMMFLGQQDCLTGIYFVGQKHFPLHQEQWHYFPDSPFFEQVSTQIIEYINGVRKVFTLPYQLIQGTPFQQKIWLKLASIPYGTTLSYRNFSEQVSTANSVRAVANAIGRNPLSILLPCHRVIGSNGSLTGFAAGLAIKKSLLTIEMEKEIT